VVTFLFTSGTVVKVLADSTFVPIANNRMGSTAITFHIGVDDLALRHLRLMKLCEDLGALFFELLFNHILHSLVRWAFLSSTLLFFLWSWEEPLHRLNQTLLHFVSKRLG